MRQLGLGRTDTRRFRNLLKSLLANPLFNQQALTNGLGITMKDTYPNKVGLAPDATAGSGNAPVLIWQCM
jgi:hypothetical protein